MWSIKHLFGLPTLCVGDVVSSIRPTKWTYRSASIQHSRAAWTGGLTMVLRVFYCVKSHSLSYLLMIDCPSTRISL